MRPHQCHSAEGRHRVRRAASAAAPTTSAGSGAPQCDGSWGGCCVTQQLLLGSKIRASTLRPKLNSTTEKQFLRCKLGNHLSKTQPTRVVTCQLFNGRKTCVTCARVCVSVVFDMRLFQHTQRFFARAWLCADWAFFLTFGRCPNLENLNRNPVYSRKPMPSANPRLQKNA